MINIKKAGFLFLLIVIMSIAGNSCAQENPDMLLRRADSEIFLRAGYSQDYSKDTDYVNEFLEGNIIHQYYNERGKSTEALTSLRPSPVRVSVNNNNLKFSIWSARVFHASFKMKRSESVPEDTGYCWMLYSDRFQTGPGKENGVIIYPGYKAFAVSPVNGESVYTEIADLSDYDINREIRVDVIRIDGISYYYFDKFFVFQYEDGLSSLLSFEGGTELFEGGNRVRCDFDDFTFLAQ